MKTRSTSRPEADQRDRSAASPPARAQLKRPSPATSGTPSLAQLRLQEMASNSGQSVALRARARMMATDGADGPVQRAAPAARSSQAGLPDRLKSGIESLSGMRLDHVNVHYNSDKPSQLQAHAYAQGSDIHLAPGQEKHLPHEAWHVVQQAQGRVRPTMQMKDGTPVNDAVDMEMEADVMGARAATMTVTDRPATLHPPGAGAAIPVQRVELNKKRLAALRKWVPSEIANDGPDYGDIKKWFTDATQLGGVEFDAILNKPFKIWHESETGFLHPDPASVTLDTVLKIGAVSEESAAASDPLDQVRKKLRSKKLQPSSFTAEELAAISAGSANGWDQAISSINQQRIEREENARLVQERTAKYSAAKALGDLVFTGGLLQDVWALSYAIAVSGSASVNTTLGQARSDAEIRTAAAAWSTKNNLRPPPSALLPQAENVTEMHVPGGPGYIQDKSTRPVNPDPTRGRQADFICHWGAVQVNVHVNSTQPH